MSAAPPPQDFHCLVCGDLQGYSRKDGIDIADILNANERGCQACRLLEDGIAAKLGQIDNVKTVTLSLDHECNTLRVHVMREGDDRPNVIDYAPKGVFLDFYTHTDARSLWPVIGPSSDVSIDSSSPECMSLALRWLDDCITNHAQCPDYEPTALPTRVIDVGSDDAYPHLYITQGERAKYTALSHCWGLSSPLTTTTATIEERKGKIPPSSLPKTFQDAIRITKALGIKFLWIDSLCIIQDSDEDWARESSRMDAVYSNSILTILADGAADGDGGCFVAGSSRNYPVAVACAGPNGTTSCVCVREDYGQRTPARVNHSNERVALPLKVNAFGWEVHEYATVSSKLNTRAWTFQERLLSPRKLHFTATEMVWECVSQFCCECRQNPEAVISKKFKDKTTSDFYLITSRKAAGGANLAPQDLPLENPYSFWCSLIEDVTERELSRGTDRLPAISGLAAMMNQFVKDVYLAGLWQKDILPGLLWSLVSSDREGRPRPSHRQIPYYAPSWSWASVTGRTGFAFRDLASKQSSAFTLEIIKIAFTPSSVNPYGPPLSGAIIVTGHVALAQAVDLRKVHVEEESLERISWGSGFKFLARVKQPGAEMKDGVATIQSINRGMPIELYVDVSRHEDEEIAHEDEIYLLQVMTYDTSALYLVLRKSRRVEGAYERVGLTNVYDVNRKWRFILRKQTLTIV